MSSFLWSSFEILSVTLFGLKINSIVKAISPGVECSLYVDDFLICYRSKHIHIIERHLQQCLNKLANWADTNGFKFSPSKTVCIHFCKLRKPHPEPSLLLNGTPVPVVEETKFLGVVFDRKLSFIPHIKLLKDKCTKALNLLRVLAHTSWGADQETLLHLYRSLIRSKLDYPALFMDLLVALTCGFLILFKTMLFVCAWVLTELLPHPVYAWKHILGEKNFHFSIA